MTTPNITGYTAAELESLTPEELSALESDAGDNADELNEIANEGGDAAGDADPAAGKAEGDKPAAGTDNALIPEDEPGTAPAYVAEAPADAAAQLDALKAAKIAAKAEDKAGLKQLMDGDIDFDQYEAIKNKAEEAIEAANESISTLNKALSKSEIASEMSQQEAARTWAGEVNNLMVAAKTEGLDYKASPALTKELNGLVRAFGQEATDNGMTDDGLKASKWALAQAHAMMKMRHPEMVKAPAAATQKKADPNAPRHTLTTLNNMPNADRALGDNDTVAKFGMLEGEALERAMATMSPAEVEKLMASV